jgi:hypothetical protein
VLFLPLRAGEKIAIGGLAEKTLKKLNGLKFGFPFSSKVLARAIGLGATALKRYECNSGVGIVPGSTFSISKNISAKCKNLLLQISLNSSLLFGEL